MDGVQGGGAAQRDRPTAGLRVQHRGLTVECRALRPEELQALDGFAVDRPLALSALQARAVLAGAQPLLLTAAQGGERLGQALATLERGRLRSQLCVSALGAVPDPERFWPAADGIGRALGATSLLLEGVQATAGATVPALPGEQTRYADECLYVCATGPGSGEAAYSKNTRRNIARAAKAGVTLLALEPDAALAAHAALTGQSLDRRAARGESTALHGSLDRVRSLLASGAGRLFQSGLDGSPLSSKFVYFLGRDAYYYDGGTSPTGMDLGASHFLMAGILASLRERGSLSLNLGIARAGSTGLMRYKEGFAPALWYVERVSFDRSTPLRLLRNGLRWPPRLTS